MNELRPVALFGGTANNNSEIWARRLKDWELPARDTELYTIPDTHRVVSVQMLETLMDCAEDSPIRRELAVYESIRAIIDNKGAT